MARVKGALSTRKRRNRVLKAAKGYWGSKSRHFKMAKQAVMKSGNYAYIGRKQKKREFRSLWITRISAQAKVCGINYSQLMHGLKLAGIDLNRKMLAEIAVSDKEAFAAIVDKAKAAL
ncbi:MAG: 50S ribosomal protein L20 [Clostridia bacterium]|nr:50S ribosomal protein L20 [Clostridia bacterium]MBR3415454.1 50S ribosomal protein L20 [Clostridia bacterium]MBR3639934.1 50S ribosomal protein L20 [Clostridia bacterium]MBR6918576.1 50S ribosomal protein L20 [Clostridia bacterium]